MLVDPLSLLFWPKGTTPKFLTLETRVWHSVFSTYRPVIWLLFPPSPHLQTLFSHKMKKKNNLKKGKSYYQPKRKKVKNKMGKLITQKSFLRRRSRRKEKRFFFFFLWFACWELRWDLQCVRWVARVSCGVVESIEYTKRFDSFHPVSDGWAKTRLDFCFVFFFFVRECTCTFTSHRNCTSSRTPVYKMEMVYNKFEIVGEFKERKDFRDISLFFKKSLFFLVFGLDENPSGWICEMNEQTLSIHRNNN